MTILDILSYLLDAYLIGCALMTIWSIYVMLTKISWNDWLDGKGKYLVEFVLSVLLWPLLLHMRPMPFLSRELMFNKYSDSYDELRKMQSERLSNLYQLEQSPPSCGKKLIFQYRYRYSSDEDPATDIIVEREKLRDTLNSGSHMINRDEVNAIRSWLHNKDDAVAEPTEIPLLFKLDEVIIPLIIKGHGEVFCNECAQYYDASSQELYQPPLHNGWNNETLLCPNGHTVIINDWIHVNMRRDADWNG